VFNVLLNNKYNPALWMPMVAYWVISGLIFIPGLGWIGKGIAGIHIFMGVMMTGLGIGGYQELKKTKRDLHTYEKEEEYFKPFQ
jgi:hypothetical protein